MRKVLICVFLILLLCGCAAMPADKELVQDSVVTAGMWSEDARDILVVLPAEAELICETQEQSCYAVNDGEFEIVTIRFLCSDAAFAVRRLTGLNPQNLNTLRRTSEFGEELYVTWCAVGEEGNRVYTADIVTDGMYTYCVVCSFDEDSKCTYGEEISEVFSGFELSGKNIV